MIRSCQFLFVSAYLYVFKDENMLGEFFFRGHVKLCGMMSHCDFVYV